MRMANQMPEDQGLTEKRVTQILSTDESHPSEFYIEDLASSQVYLLDDIVKVNQILRDIMEHTSASSGTDYSKMSAFLAKWAAGDLTTDLKNRYYSEYMSHELNLFLKTWDTSYFKSVVQPLLHCKLEKTLVDHYLLEDYRKVCESFEVHLVGSINAMERCLLVDGLVRQGQAEKARMLAKKMAIELETRTSRDPKGYQEYHNKIFDMILSSDSLNVDKSGIAQAKERIMQMEQQLHKEQESEEESEDMDVEIQERGGAPRGLFDESESEDDDDEEFGADSSSDEGLAGHLRSKAPSLSRQKSSAKARRAAYPEDQDLGDFFGRRSDEVQRQVFEKVEPTSEYMETHYFTKESSIPVNEFWVDLAHNLVSSGESGVKRPFITPEFVRCDSAHQAFLVQCFLDLPYKGTDEQIYRPDNKHGVTIEAKTNLIVYAKQTQLAPIERKNDDILVVHRYEKLPKEQGQDQEGGKPEVFLTQTIYNCEIVITNNS